MLRTSSAAIKTTPRCTTLKRMYLSRSTYRHLSVCPTFRHTTISLRPPPNEIWTSLSLTIYASVCARVLALFFNSLDARSEIDCLQADAMANAAIPRPTILSGKKVVRRPRNLPTRSESKGSALSHNRKFLCGVTAFERIKALTRQSKWIWFSHWHGKCFIGLPNLTFSTPQKQDRHMIDGAKRKRRNGTKGEPRRKWYARWRVRPTFWAGQIG